MGPRGAGKTTVGRILAERLGRDFRDLDECIERTEGRTTEELFRAEGEEGFRGVESRVLCAGVWKDCVVALGGGVVLKRENRAFLKEHGSCIWLDAEPGVLAGRLACDPEGNRRRPPLYSGAVSQREEVKRARRDREPFYRELALVRVDTSRLFPEEVAERILVGLDQSHAIERHE
jgi:shikimate kinase